MVTKKTLFSFGFTSQKSKSDNTEECSNSVHNHDVATSFSECESKITFSAQEDNIEVVQEIATVYEEDKEDETATTSEEKEIQDNKKGWFWNT